jgi:hypothetical protein
VDLVYVRKVGALLAVRGRIDSVAVAAVRDKSSQLRRASLFIVTLAYAPQMSYALGMCAVFRSLAHAHEFLSSVRPPHADLFSGSTSSPSQ